MTNLLRLQGRLFRAYQRAGYIVLKGRTVPQTRDEMQPLIDAYYRVTMHAFKLGWVTKGFVLDSFSEGDSKK